MYQIIQVINLGFIPVFIHHLHYIPRSSPLFFLIIFLSTPCPFILTLLLYSRQTSLFSLGQCVSYLIFSHIFLIPYAICIASMVPLGLASNPSNQSWTLSLSLCCLSFRCAELLLVLQKYNFASTSGFCKYTFLPSFTMRSRIMKWLGAMVSEQRCLCSNLNSTFS